MPSLMFLNMLLDFSCDHPIVVFEANRGGFDDEGFGDFACCVVGDGNDGAVGYGGVGKDVGFEFGGSDLEALRILVSC